MALHIIREGGDYLLISTAPLKELAKLSIAEALSLLTELREVLKVSSRVEPVSLAEEALEEEGQGKLDFPVRTAAALASPDPVVRSKVARRHLLGIRQGEHFPTERQEEVCKRASVMFDSETTTRTKIADLAHVSHSTVCTFLRRHPISHVYGEAIETAVCQVWAAAPGLHHRVSS